MLPAVAAALVCMIWSCNSKDTALLDSVPVDSKAVAMVNAKDVLSNMGCSFEKDGLKMSDALKSVFPFGKLGQIDLSALSAVAKGIDIEKLVIFQPDGMRDPVMTFIVTDAAEIDNLATKGENKAQKSEVKGYTVYFSGKQSVLIKEDRGWLVQMEPEKAAETVDGILESASGEGKSVGSVTALNDFMATTHAAGIVANMAGSGFGDKDSWTLADVILDGNTMGVNMKWVKSTGEEIKQDYFQEIDTDFLRYVPGDFNLVFAMGVKDGEKLAQAIQGATGMLGFQQRAILGALIPYLRQVDGTLSIAMVTPDPNATADIDNLKFIAMVKMPQAKVDEAVSDLNAMLGTYGAKVEKSGPGYKAVLQGTTFYLANADGNLAVATVPIESTRNNSLTSRVQNNDMALSVIIPSLTGYFRGAPSCGVDFSGVLKGNEMMFKCTFTGTKAGFLETLAVMTK